MHLDTDGNDGADDWALMSMDGGATKTGVNWDNFAEDMANARVVATVSYSTEGQLTINAVSTGVKNGYQYFVDNVGHVTGTGDLTVNLSVSNSWLEIISVQTTDLILQDGKDNDWALEHSGETMKVTLKDRTLFKDDSWNTLCLPFSLSDEETATLLGDNGTLMELDVDDKWKMVNEQWIIDNEKGTNQTGFASDGTLYLYFKPAERIEAGKPYIVKWKGGDNLVNPIFDHVTIGNAAAATVSAANSGLSTVQFIGTYKPVALVLDEKSNLFLGGDDTLYYPHVANNADGNYYVNAFRAYFHVDFTGGVNEVRAFVLGFGEEAGETTAIADTLPFTSSSSVSGWYSLDGRRLSGVPTAKGLYIHEGRKVVVK